MKTKKKVKKSNLVKYLLLIPIILGIFILVYYPHYSYSLPFHIDEWHHITEALKISKGTYSGGSIGFRAGFHIVLYLISLFTDLVLIYKYLPAIWAVVSGLTLFFLMKNKTKKFWLALYAIIFFASIKSDINITGILFFTSLSFSIPLIYGYVFLFTEGLKREKNSYIFYSFLIMLSLIFIHSISLLFAIPFLIIYTLLYRKYVIKNYKIFSLFLSIPIIGLIFYSYMTSSSFLTNLLNIWSIIQFPFGWGVYESTTLIQDFARIYSLMGYLLAIIGVYSLMTKYKEKYSEFLIWPITLLVLMILYKMVNISFFSPYQRNLYYFALSLPILSAFGFEFILKGINKILDDQIKSKFKKQVKIVISGIIIIGVLYLIFMSYYSVSKQFKTYQPITEGDYEMLKQLKEMPTGKVMAPLSISTAVYPISLHETIGSLYFYGNKTAVEEFFRDKDCENKINLVQREQIIYVISKKSLDCNWTEIYNNGNILYKTQN